MERRGESIVATGKVVTVVQVLDAGCRTADPKPETIEKPPVYRSSGPAVRGTRPPATKPLEIRKASMRDGASEDHALEPPGNPRTENWVMPAQL